MINTALITGKASTIARAVIPGAAYPAASNPGRLFSVSLLAGMLLLSGCNNSLDLRSRSQEPAEDSALDHANMQSARASALSITEAASAERYINNQDVMHTTFNESKTNVQAVPSESLVKQFAGRYTGQVPCTVQSLACSSDKVDMTLTLLPNGSAIRTLAAQGKVNAMLDKEVAAWTVSANGQNIMLILPNHEIWSFKKIGLNQLQFQPNASAMVEPAEALGQYSLMASNS